MSAYDYSIRITGLVDLRQIREDLARETFKIDISMSDATKKMISDLKKAADELNLVFDNMAKSASQVARVADVIGVRGGRTGASKTKTSEITRLEAATFERSRTAFQARLEKEITAGEQGLFHMPGGEKLREQLEDILFIVKNIGVEAGQSKEFLVNGRELLAENEAKLNNLKTSWDEIKSSAKGTNVEVKELNQSLEYARLEKTKAGLKSQIQSRLDAGTRLGSFDTKTESYDGREVRKSYEDLIEKTNKLTLSSGNYRKEIEEIKTELHKLAPAYRELQKETQRTHDATDNLWTMFQKKMVSAVAYRMIFTFFNTLRWAITSTIKTTLDLDKQLTNINKVLSMTTSQMKEIVIEANNLAQAYGKTTVEAMQAMESFAKAGYSYNEMVGLTELSLRLQNVGDMSSDAASSFIIAANAAYQLDGNLNKLSKTIDMVNHLANNAAVSVDFLSEAMKVSGSVAFSAGLSMEEYTAALTTIGEATQRSGREVGNGLRTILMRLTQVTDSSGDMADGMSKVEEVLHNVGVEIRDTPSTFRPAMEILGDLAGKWEELTDIQQRAVTYRLAGVYRSNILEAFLANINEYEENLFLALNSVGSATKENEMYMNSLEAAIKRLRATWEEFVNRVKASNTIRIALKVAEVAVKNLENVLHGLAATIVAYVLASIAQLVISAGGLAPAFAAAISSVKAFGVALHSALGVWGWIALAITTVIGLVRRFAIAQKDSFDNYMNDLEEGLRKAQDTLSSVSELNTLIYQYEKLYNQYIKTGEGAEQLAELQNRLSNSFGEQARGIDLVNGNLETNLKLLSQISEEELKRTLRMTKTGFLKAQDFLQSNVKDSGILTGKEQGFLRLALIPEGENLNTSQFSLSDTSHEELLDLITLALDDPETHQGDLEVYAKVYSKLSNALEKNKEIVEGYYDVLRQLVWTEIAPELRKLSGKESSLFSFVQGLVDLGEGTEEDLARYKKTILKIVDILDGINADNAEEKWDAILGLGVSASREDRKNFLDHVTNTGVVLQNLIAQLQSNLGPYEQYLKQLEAIEKAQSNIYDLRRKFAEEAGLIGEDYKSFALGGDGFLNLIEDDRLRGLAREIQDDFIRYQEDIRRSEEEGLNNQSIITALYETQFKIKEKEFELLKKQIALEERRKSLHALEDERTQAIFIGGQMVYTVDYEALDKAREEMEQAEKEITDLESQIQTDKILADQEKERLDVTKNIEEIIKSIENSVELGADSLLELTNSLENLPKDLLYGIEDEKGNRVGGVGNILNEIYETLLENEGRKADSAVVKTMKKALDTFYDRITRIVGNIKNSDSGSINVNNIYVEGVDNLEDLTKEIKEQARRSSGSGVDNTFSQSTEFGYSSNLR